MGPWGWGSGGGPTQGVSIRMVLARHGARVQGTCKHGACKRVGGHARSVKSHPKMIPKSTQNHPKAIPKSSQNHPKVIPKSTQNHPKVNPKPSQSHPKIIPKSYQNHPKVIPKSADPWSCVLEPVGWGEVSSPLPPSALGTSPQSCDPIRLFALYT